MPSILTSKKCCKCKAEQPVDRFNKNRSTKDGLSKACKACLKAEARKICNKYRNLEIRRDPPNHKLCNMCHQDLPISDFGSNRLTPTGVDGKCRKCASNKSMAVYRSNPDLHNAKAKDRRDAMTEDQKKAMYEKQAANRKANRQEYLRKGREYYNKNAFRSSYATRKSRMDRDPEYKERRRIIESRRRLKRRNILMGLDKTITITAREWSDIKDRVDHRCLKCNLAKPLTMDHVVPVSKRGSGSHGNIQPLCRSCNSSKRDNFIDYRPWTMDSDEIGLSYPAASAIGAY